MARRKDPAAVKLGRRGGQVRSPAKAAAARENGKLGGRPRLIPTEKPKRFDKPL